MGKVNSKKERDERKGGLQLDESYYCRNHHLSYSFFPPKILCKLPFRSVAPWADREDTT